MRCEASSLSGAHASLPASKPGSSSILLRSSFHLRAHSCCSYGPLAYRLPPLPLPVADVLAPVLLRLSAPRDAPPLDAAGWDAAALVMLRAAVPVAIARYGAVAAADDGGGAGAGDLRAPVRQRVERLGLSAAAAAAVRVADAALCVALAGLGFDADSADALVDAFVTVS
jgi:hypothetical protein